MGYSDNAGAIIANVYKFCMEEKKSGMELSLNRISEDCGREEEGTSSNRQSNHRHLRRKCHWMTLTRVLSGGPSPACTP